MSYEFGSILKRHRNIKGLSQTQLLEKLRDEGHELYSKGTVSKWENGINTPMRDVVEDLDEILDLPKGTLLRAAGYLIEIEATQQNRVVADLVTTQLKKKEHSDQLADIASILLENGLDTLTLADPTENQKGNPDWIEYFKLYKYRVYDYNSDSGSQITQKQLVLEMERNIDAVYSHYKDDSFDCFLSHLKAEPEMEGRELFNVLDSNPLQLIEILRLRAQEKTFKGTCPVCKDWCR